MIDPNEYTKEEAEIAVNTIINYIGENQNREGLKETAKRHIKFLDEFLSPEPFNFTTFDREGFDEMIIVKDINFYSLCEHHVVPFFGVAHIAYIPNIRIAGISKLPRVLDHFARRLNNQERITSTVAKFMQGKLKAKGVAVVLEARHLCMEMRGIQKTGAKTITSAMLGKFKTDSNCRNEFLNLIK